MTVIVDPEHDVLPERLIDESATLQTFDGVTSIVSMEFVNDVAVDDEHRFGVL